MNKEIRDEWVKRLRSGKYDQGKTYLRHNEQYCCLGILCEMAVEAGVTTVTEIDEKGRYTYNENFAALPLEVQKWSGVDSDLGDYEDHTHRDFLYRNNDQDLMDFNAIADIIEREF